MLIKVAWRNIWRHKTRSMVIMLSVVFGLWAGLFMVAYVNGMIEQRVSTAIEKEISHIQLHHPDFKTDYEVKYLIGNGKNILIETGKMQHVKSVSGRIITKGMIATATGSAGVKINGVEPVSEDSTTHLGRNIREGKYFLPEVKNEIVISEKLLKKLKLKLNSKVVLTIMDKDNNIASGAFRIKGVFKTLHTPYDEANVFVDRDDFASLTSTPDEINEIAVLLTSNSAVDTIYSKLKSLYPSVKTETWMEVAPEMDLIVSSSGQSMYIYMGIIMLALAFGIINTMMMAVLERTREIGMLMALGMSRIKVFTMILMETAFLVFTATPIGLLLATATVMYYGHFGINRSDAKEVFESFGMSEIIFPTLTFRDYRMMLELVIITSLLSALFPARKALSLNPSEAIRK